MTQNNLGKLVFCTAGIFTCYSYYAILQEKVTRGQYVDGDVIEKFTYVVSLVFIQCVVNCMFARVLLSTVMKQGEDLTRIKYYATSSLTYLLAMVATNMSLRFVNYPTQVVAKSAKPVPIMILGVLLGGKTYSLKKYICVLLVVSGVCLFMYKDKGSAMQQESSTYGQLLLLFSLTMDGLTSTIQERMRGEHKTKSGHMMLNMNIWSSVFSGFMILATGEVIEFVNFLQRHPSALMHIGSLSIAGALGQYFIFLTVADFGPLACSIATTTRKSFTVLASVVFFGNSLMTRQWLAAGMVFTGLFLESFLAKNRPLPKKN